MHINRNASGKEHWILILQMFGWLSNPFVTALYFMEQAEILLFGGTARASDLRILVSFVVNCLFVVIFTHSAIHSDANLTIIYAIVAFILSKNYLHTFGLKKPFKIENEEMARQRTNAEIVFENLEKDPEVDQKKAEERRLCSNKTMIFNAVGFVAVLIAAIVFQVLFIAEDDPL